MGEEVIDEMVDSCVLMRTRLISRVITNIYDQELRPLGINSAQLALLALISKRAPVTAAEIGRFHHQDRSTLARNLKIMLAEGWIEDVRDDVGGRGRPMVPTKAGRDLVQDAEPAWRAGQAQADIVLGAAGVNAITEIADRILYPRKPP